jgi:hypothetical protein
MSPLPLDILTRLAYVSRMSDLPPLPRPRRCLIVRVDYGHAPLEVPPAWAEADLSRQSLDEALLVPRGARGLCLRRADWALAWAGTRAGAREGDGVFARLARIAARSGLALECRFPRHAASLASNLEAAGCLPDLWQSEADGSVPPLYRGLSGDLARFHLEHEWESALGAARGGAALLRVALVLAREGPQTAPLLAGRLGLTAGATRAYLGWMEDVALVRRTRGRYDLRHPLLGELFKSGAAAPPVPDAPPPAPRAPARRPAAAVKRPEPVPARSVEPPEAISVRRPSEVDWD